MILWGKGLFGWVDAVEGEGQVATRFFHVLRIPLIPIDSWMVVEQNYGLELELDIKSIAVAWLDRMIVALVGLLLLAGLVSPWWLGTALMVAWALGVSVGWLGIRAASWWAPPARKAELIGLLHPLPKQASHQIEQAGRDVDSLQSWARTAA